MTSFTLTADPTNATRLTSFYAPEKDTTVKITLAAGAGQDRNGNKGGEGGKSVFIVTLEQNKNMQLNLEHQAPTGGSKWWWWMPHISIKVQVEFLLPLGGGGGAGGSGRGGNGGGIGLAGQNGDRFRGAGAGGSGVATGELNLTRIMVEMELPAGRLLACTIGSTYFRNNYTACQDYGTL